MALMRSAFSAPWTNRPQVRRGTAVERQAGVQVVAPLPDNGGNAAYGFGMNDRIGPAHTGAGTDSIGGIWTRVVGNNLALHAATIGR